ncbi:hypothetical protein BC628DRAFT_1420479 [Trametes gibbosa]|nr:hypothetical protein BC628DRAFT_1420479 [Trametes gibbosa]
MDYNLDVSIDINILPTLVKAGYQLCIAKKVNGVYTVIWQGSNILSDNQFSWSSKYQVFGSIGFQSGALVRATTNVQNIMSGQTATLDQYGIMNSASGSQDGSGKFTVQNKYGLINLGVNSYVNGTYAPSYVSANPVVSGPTVLAPIESVMVWFDINVKTGTMILKASSQAIEVDFTSIPSHSLLYKVPDGAPPGAGVWYLDNSQAVLPMTYDLDSNSFSIPEPSDATLALMSELLNASTSRPSPGFASPVVAVADFVTDKHAAEFGDYLRANKPEEFTRWDVSSADNVISVTMQVTEVADDDAAAVANEGASVRAASDKYLELAYAYGGPQFRKLRFTVERRADDPTDPASLLTVPGGEDSAQGHARDDQLIGTAVVSFNTPADAGEFATYVRAHPRAAGVEMQASAGGPSVVVKLRTQTTARGNNREAAYERVRETYAGVVGAFQSTPGRPKPVYVGHIVWGECHGVWALSLEWCG